MKNLRKVLALVLVVASLMGLGMSAGAVTFTDADKVVNVQAVDVMVATNVIGGMPDGSFNPTGDVTRAQMAKIVSAILNGGDDIGNLYASANTFTDCTTHWAKSYVAYAANMKIVSGVGNGKFNPEGSVTGVAAAKMMLVALGYDPAVEIYTGKDWVANVMADAKDAGLLKSLPKNFNFSASLSRDNAAQMAFNALQATMVVYENTGANINLGDTTINIGASKATPKTTTDSTYGGNIAETEAEKDASIYTVQLGEQVFDNLIRSNDQEDSFGRPSSKWSNDRKDIGTYANAATLSYTASKKSSELYADLGKPVMTGADALTGTIVTYFEDGFAGTAAKNNDVKADLIAKNSDTLGGAGALMEMFYDRQADTLVVTVVNTYVGKISSFTAANTAKDEAAYVVVAPQSSAPVGAFNNKFETTAFTKDDANKTFVLYTAAWDDATSKYTLQEVVAAPTVRGVLNGYSSASNKETVTVDGKAYSYSAKVGVKGPIYTASTGALKDIVDLYLDNEGNVISIQQYQAESKDLAVVVAMQENNNLNGKTYEALLALTDGTMKTVVLDGVANFTEDANKPKSYGSAEFAANPDVRVAEGGIVSYTIDSKTGNYTLTQKVNGVTSGDDRAVANVATNLDIKKGSNTIATGGANVGNEMPALAANYYTDDSTIFIVKTMDNGKHVIKTYTGFKNVAGQVQAQAGGTMLAVYTDNNVAKVVYVSGATETNAGNNLIYVANKSYQTINDSEFGSYDLYNAVVNGEVTSIRISTSASGDAAVDKTADFAMFKSYTANGKDVIQSATNASTVAPNPDYTTGAGVKPAANGVITVNKTPKTYTADCKVFYIDEDGKIEKIAVDTIVEDTDDKATYTMNTDGHITNLYIQYFVNP